jgi:dTMP kinase
MKHIAFEGIDGAGKSTQVDTQYSRLQDMQIPTSVYRYSEKNNMWGKIIRKAYSLNQQSSLHFLFKSRIIQETLYALSARANLRLCRRDNSELLLSDRSIVTAYASHLNDVPEWFISLIEPPTTPNLVIYLDIPPEVGLKRINDRYSKFRDEDLESLTEFRDLYINVMSEKRPKRLKDTDFVIVDATKSLEEVTSEATRIIDEFRR